MRIAPPRRRAHTSQRATGRLGVFSAVSTLAMSLALLIPPGATAFEAPGSASWHGRAIQDPQPRGDAVMAAASFPRGWSAGPVRLGTGFRNANGSERVREVQRRLWRLGYRPGPVDGLFGPRTEAATRWFQMKHGIEPDGIVGGQTLNMLRERTGAAPGRAPTGELVRDTHEGAHGAAPQPQRATPVADRGEEPAGGQGGGVSPLLLLLAVPAALALTALRRSRRPASGSSPEPGEPDAPAADREPVPAPPPAPVPPAAAPAPPAPAEPPEASSAIGYVRAAAGDRAELGRHAGVIRRACAERGWKVTELVCDDRQAGARPAFERPGLAAAMGHLAGAGPSRLVVSKLAHLSRSQADLTALLEWFDRNGVQVIAMDAGLDTTTPQGRRAAQSQLAAFALRAHANGSNGGSKKAKVNGASART
jgi:putative peptidoglycan binding protein/resolvase-like protein